MCQHHHTECQLCEKITFLCYVFKQTVEPIVNWTVKSYKSYGWSCRVLLIFIMDRNVVSCNFRVIYLNLIFDYSLIYNCSVKQGSLLLTQSNFDPAWMNNHIPSKMWHEITYPSPDFIGCTVDFRNFRILGSFFIPHFIMDIIYLSMLALRLIHVNTSGPWR